MRTGLGAGAVRPDAGPDQVGVALDQDLADPGALGAVRRQRPQPRPAERGRLAPQVRDEAGWPFCGDEYPPLKGAPGTVVCTKPRYPATDMHLNEETGWGVAG